MWSEFEWENKVNVNTDIQDLYAFVNNICKITHMKCLTDLSLYEHSNDCMFLAANLYISFVYREEKGKVFLMFVR